MINGKINLGMPTLIELTDPGDTVSLCQSLNLDLIELNMNMVNFCPENLNPEEVRKIKDNKAIDFTLHLPEEIDLASFHPSIRRGHLQRCRKALKWSYRAGIELVNLHINSGIYFTLPQEKVRIYDRYEEKFLDNLMESFEELTAIAAEKNIKICLENSSNFHFPYIRKALNKLCTFSEIGLTWDSGHDAAVNFREKEVMLKHKDKISHLHLHDFSNGSDHQVLFTGEVDIEEMLALAAERQLRVIIETKTATALEKSVKKLRRYEN